MEITLVFLSLETQITVVKTGLHKMILILLLQKIGSMLKCFGKWLDKEN